MGIILQYIAYAVAGFLQEVMIVAYHRAINCERKLLASVLTVTITMVSLLVVAQVTHQIIVDTGLLSLLGAAIFAVGKGVGAFLTISWWGREGARVDAKTPDKKRILS